MHLDIASMTFESNGRGTPGPETRVEKPMREASMTEDLVTIHPGQTALSQPDKPAIVLDDGRVAYSYREFEEASNRFANLLNSRGIGRGDGVAILLENRPEFLALAWGAWRIGAYVTAIATHLAVDEIAYILSDSGAQVLVTSPVFAERLGRIPDGTRRDFLKFMIDSAEPGFEALDAQLATQPGTPPDRQYEGVEMLYSSGTTGRPKGIRKPLPERPFGTIAPFYRAVQELYEITGDTCYLSPAPLYHSAPLQWTLRTLRAGGTVVLMRKFDAERALALIEEFRVTHSQWVPTHFVRLRRLPQDAREKYDLSSHQCAIHAAAPCPVDLKHEMIEWWGPILREYYAGSEGIGHTSLDTEEWLRHPGSVGRPVGCKVHICDDNGDPLPAGETGDVFFESANTFEYLNDPAKTSDAKNRHGWWTLGDIGHLDADGYLFLTDRRSNTIISGGVNIYPQEIENLLQTHPKVEDIAVIGVPNPEFGEEIKAVVQLTDRMSDHDATRSELTDFCRANLSAVKCPRSFDFVEALPREENGKLYKKKLAESYR